MRFASSSSSYSLSQSTSSPDPTHFEDQMQIDPFAMLAPEDQPNIILRSPVLSCSQSETIINPFADESSSQTSPNSDSIRELYITPSVASSESRLLQFFLQYHREKISASHYFFYFDYKQTFMSTLFRLGQHSDALQYSIVAFSAFIYSMKINRALRVQAFLFYTFALRQLRVLLDAPSLETDEYQAALATALQLATFDVLSRPVHPNFSAVRAI